MEKEENVYKDLKEKIDKGKIFIDEPMKNYTSLKIGGNAKILLKLDSIGDLINTFEIIKKYNLKFFILGNGTNILVKDEGFDGIIIKYKNEKIEEIENEEKNVIVTVGSSVKLVKLATLMYKKGITGLEFASGIPGTIGGAIKMNAGAYKGEMKDIVINTTYMDLEGNIKTISNEEQKFEYRKSIFKELKGIILETRLLLKYGKKEEIKKIMDENLLSRKEKQPIEYPNAGSTFKRGKDFITAKLIDETGLKGYTIGGAKVSEKHAGFLINYDNATSKDMIKLINYVRRKVKDTFDKDIELEIEII